MSFQRDYLLRMIEMLGDFVIALLGKIKKGEFEDANQQIEQIYYDFLKMDAAFFRSLPLEGMTDKLINEHNYTNNHLHILAELFLVEAELRLAKEDKVEGRKYLMKALKLWEYNDIAQKTYSAETNNKMNLMREKIKELE